MVNTLVIVPNPLINVNYFDIKQLKSQRREVKTIIESLEKIDYVMDNNLSMNSIVHSKLTINNHPAVAMWIGYTYALKYYYNCIVRKINDTKTFRYIDSSNISSNSTNTSTNSTTNIISEIVVIDSDSDDELNLYNIDESLVNIVDCHFDGISTYFNGTFNKYSFPPWFTFPPFYMSHRAFLYLKDPIQYSFLYCPELEPYLKKGFLWPTRTGNNIYIKWDMNYLEDLSLSVPAKHRYTYEETIMWLQNPSFNPKTGRKIKENGTLHKEYMEAAVGHGLIR